MSLRVDSAAVRALAAELEAEREKLQAYWRRASPLRATFSRGDESPVEPDRSAVDRLEQMSRRVAEKEAAMARIGAAETVPCGVCGKPQRVTDWVDVSTYGDAVPRLLPSHLEPCPTPRCGEVCKVCRREPGDVHGPDCGPLMFAKLERPHIVDKSDCR